MTYRGHVSGGVVVPDVPLKLPEGTHVIIRVETKPLRDPTGVAGSWVDDRSAAEIVKEIKQARRSRK